MAGVALETILVGVRGSVCGALAFRGTRWARVPGEDPSPAIPHGSTLNAKALSHILRLIIF